jgi:signal transduction histidine kinase
MNKPYSLIKILFYLILFLNSVSKIDAQSIRLTKHIEEKLIDIDELIANKNYNLALSKLTDLESYKDYITSNENRLDINLKRAQAFYGNDEEETAMGLLLNGLDELESLKLSKLKTSYTKYLGEIFWDSKDYKRSLEYNRKSLISSYEINDTINILDSYFNIGKSHAGQGNIDSAVHYYEIIGSYPQTKRTEGIIAKSYNNLSATALEIEDLEMAREYANKNIEIRKRQNDTLEIARAIVNLSGIDFVNEKYIEAENSYSEAHKLVILLKSESALKLKSLILYNLAYSNEMLNKFEKAYKYLEQATDLQDSLADATLTKNISEVNAKYNVEKEARKTEEEKSKRQQTQYFFYGSIMLFAALLVLTYIFYRNYRLKRENELDKIVNETQIKIINATIDAKENERKSIAETLHDSVSALLSSANLHLQATKAQLKTGYPQEITKAQTIVNEASVKIRDLSHELISSVLLKFGLAFAVHDMCQKYSNSEISLFSDDDGIKRYEQNFEIKIHNIIEELVNNILKHSKAKNASIILAHRDNNMLSIRMNDDGIGFDAKNAKMKGGLGLSHIDARIKVMKGVFNIVSSKDNGTSIFILVPIVSQDI